MPKVGTTRCERVSETVGKGTLNLSAPGIHLFDKPDCADGSKHIYSALTADFPELYVIRASGTDNFAPKQDDTKGMNNPVSLAIRNPNTNIPFEYKLCKEDRTTCPYNWRPSNMDDGEPYNFNEFPDGTKGKVNWGLRWKDVDDIRAKCCSGTVSGEVCGRHLPASPDCKAHMTQYCQDSEDNFFGNYCQKWIKMFPNKTNDPSGEYSFKDSMVGNMCDRRPDAAECGCYKVRANLEQLKENDPKLARLSEEITRLGVALYCNDPGCSSEPKAIKPYEHDTANCPRDITYCNIEDVKVNLQNANVENITVQNMCQKISTYNQEKEDKKEQSETKDNNKSNNKNKNKSGKSSGQKFAIAILVIGIILALIAIWGFIKPYRNKVTYPSYIMGLF